MQELLIEYSDPAGVLDPLTIRFKLKKYPIVEKWVNKVLEAKKLYKIDDPARFYGFGQAQQVNKLESIRLINSYIDTINNYKPIIDRRLVDPIDQDTLNYLHRVFEVYHGMLNEQDHEFWENASSEVHHALAQLNIEIHRCESLVEGNKELVPRHVVTWFGLPKKESIELSDYDLLTDYYTFGTVYLNYVEIGKTIEDLAIDNDDNITEEAFKPFHHYSSDFTVKYHGTLFDSWRAGRMQLRKYYLAHEDFFKKLGLSFNHPYCKPGLIPLAEIIAYPFDVVKEISKRQYVSDVSFR